MMYYLSAICGHFSPQLHRQTNQIAKPRTKYTYQLLFVLIALSIIVQPSSRAVFAESSAGVSTTENLTTENLTTEDLSTGGPSTFLIALEPDLSEEARAELLENYSAELVDWMPEISLAEVRFGGTIDDEDDSSTSPGTARSNMSVSALTAQMESESSVEFVEENTFFYGTGTVPSQKVLPDDPELHDSTNGYAQQLLHMESAWGRTMGNESVIIAVLDTGIDALHPEMAGQLVPGYDFVNDTSNVVDDNGHGTHVGGIIAARINNNEGSAGICPRCKLMPVKVLDRNNVGLWSVIVNGIIFAADNGAQVINLSLGSADQSKAVQRAVVYAQEKGALLVAAAGNSRSRELFFPAAYSGVISVAATDKEDREWNLSNQGTYIDVAAPGYLIYSTSIGNEQYSYMTGTSMAAPFVSGLAGLLLSQAPYSTATDLTDRIIHNTVDLGTPGWDSTFGFGRVDAYAALTNGQSSQSASPAGNTNRLPTVYLPFVSGFANQ